MSRTCVYSIHLSIQTVCKIPNLQRGLYPSADVCQDRFSRSETDTDGDAKAIGERVGSGSYYSRIARVEAKRVRVDE